MIDQHLFDMTNLLGRERNGGATEQICPIDTLRTMFSKIVALLGLKKSTSW